MNDRPPLAGGGRRPAAPEPIGAAGRTDQLLPLPHGCLDGRYRLVELLAEGGMSRVWRGRDDLLRREVAVKEVLVPAGSDGDGCTEPYARPLGEARAAARLSHPNVVQVHDLLSADGRYWIVMEYVPARSLHQVISEEGPLPPDRTALIGLAILAALTAAHRHGILHNDVKPGNVLIAAEGRVLLTDFGLATVEDVEGGVVRPGVILGSPDYIAPERALDGRSRAQSDLWSLGATLYAAVEGRSPFDRTSTAATLVALVTEPPDRPLRAGPLRPVLRGLLRKDPGTRMGPVQAERLLRRVARGARRYRCGSIGR